MREEVAAMVEDIQLMDEKDTQASKLSGGMKRKLRYIKKKKKNLLGSSQQRREIYILVVNCEVYDYTNRLGTPPKK